MTPRLACPSRTSACAAALIAPRSFAMTRADARCSFFGSGWLGPSRRAYRLRAYARLRRRGGKLDCFVGFRPTRAVPAFPPTVCVHLVCIRRIVCILLRRFPPSSPAYPKNQRMSSVQTWGQTSSLHPAPSVSARSAAQERGCTTSCPAP